MTKKYQTTELDTNALAVPEQVSVVMNEIAADMREGLLALAVGAAEPVPDDQPAGGVSRPRVERAESRRFSSAIPRLTSAADSAFRSAVGRGAPGRAENSKA